MNRGEDLCRWIALFERDGNLNVRSATSFFSHGAVTSRYAHREEIGAVRDELNPIVLEQHDPPMLFESLPSLLTFLSQR